MTVITLGELLDAGVHFGHQSSRWNPKMFPYIYAEQNGIHVIDLVQTARLLTHAYNYAQKGCLLYTSPSPRDRQKSRMPSSA